MNSYSIVVVNEFTVLRNGSGTRGSTPVNYVLDYMSRSDAVENIPPVIRSYEFAEQNRYDIHEKLKDFKDPQKNYRTSDGLGGVAFGDGQITLTHEELLEKANQIQKMFEQGRTVFKTVISFSGKYLEDHHLLQLPYSTSSLMGCSDHGRLREAVCRGIERMSRSFQNMRWIGVFQSDTDNLHCHLVMCDDTDYGRMHGNEQNGMLYKFDKKLLRSGIEDALILSDPCRFWPSSYVYEKEELSCVVQRQAAQAAMEQNLLMRISADLPEDPILWNSQNDMPVTRQIQKFVESALSRDRAYLRLKKSFSARAKAMYPEFPELAAQKEKELMNDFYRDAVDSVYDVFKMQKTAQMQELSYFQQRMLEPVKDAPRDELFTFRMRCSRKKKHFKNAKRAHEMKNTAEEAVKDNGTLMDVLKFWQEEEEYELMLHEKYRNLFFLLDEEEEVEKIMIQLMEQAKMVNKLQKMKNDSAFASMNAVKAEEYGRKFYQVRGGRYMVKDPSLIDLRIKVMEERFKKLRHELDFYLKLEGKNLDQKNRIVYHDWYGFEKVKALDLHHLNAKNVSSSNQEVFQKKSIERADAAFMAERALPGCVPFEIKEDIEAMRTGRFSRDAGREDSRVLVPDFLHEKVIRRLGSCVQSYADS